MVGRACRGTARDGLDQWDQLGDVVAVAAGGDRGKRDAVRLDDQLVLAVGLAPVHRGRTGGRPALHRADVAGVNRSAGEVQQVCGPQPGQQQLVQALPDPGPRSSPAAVASRSSPSRSSAPVAETPSGSRYTARTGSRTAPCDYPDAYDPDAADYAGRPAPAARSAPTTPRRSPTVWKRSSSSRPARTPFGQHQRELTHRHSQRSRNPPFVRSRKARQPFPRSHVEVLPDGTEVKLGVFLSNTKARRAKLTADKPGVGRPRTRLGSAKGMGCGNLSLECPQSHGAPGQTSRGSVALCSGALLRQRSEGLLGHLD